MTELAIWTNPADRDAVRQELKARGSVQNRELLFTTKTGGQVVGLFAAEVIDLHGEPVLVAVTRDITERKRAEAQLQATLAEKEAALATNQTLLREVHHRVKNNLQMLCDLLFLQAEGTASAEAESALQDAYGRIYAIARLHEQLYQTLQSGGVPLGTYLSRLVGGFASVYPTIRVRLEIGDDRVGLDVDRAIHVGLIVNELVTNALKHAFPTSTAGEVTVRLHRVDESVELQVRDDGQGLPHDFDLDHATSLGLRIVHILARRLEATVSIENHHGTFFTITFPLQADAAIEPRED
jgi:two-component sensor histidine kinase